MQTLHHDLPIFSRADSAVESAREFDLFDLARLALRGWWLIALCILGCVILGEIYLESLARKTYKAEGQLLLHNGGVVFPGAKQPNAQHIDDVLNTQVELILSSENLDRLSSDLGLVADPELRQATTQSTPTPETLRELRRILSVSRVPQSFVINISAQSHDRTLALRLIDQLSNIHTDRELARKSATIDRQIQSLMRGLVVVKRDLAVKNETLLKLKRSNSLAPAMRIEAHAPIERDIAVLEQQHQEALGALVDMRRERQAVRSDVTILSLANITKTSGTSALVLRAVAVLTGLAFGLGTLLWWRFVYSGVRTAADLADLTPAPILARFPKLERGAALPQLVGNRACEPAAEGLRDLRAALLSRLDPTKRGQAIMVTASHYQEGTAAIAVALAKSLSAISYRILLIEADMRAPRLAKLLGVPATCGLEDVLSRRCTIPIAAIKAGPNGPDMLVARPTTRAGCHASDLLGHPSFGPLIARARKTYDMVIVTAPPCLNSADPLMIARTVDGVIYTANWNSTKRTDIAKGLFRLSKYSAPIIGVVLNKCGARWLNV